MLKNLYIENIALISKLDLSFEKGLSVLSGETGAGKSIIVDSLAFVLGGRADKTLIKSDEKTAFVEAVFDVPRGGRAGQVLDELGFGAENGCMISRSLAENGKNEIRVNGRVTSLAVLKQVTATLADIFGQSEQTYLLKSENHIGILDGFMSDGALLLSVRNAYSELKNIEKELRKYGGSDAERARALDMLRFQIEEIESANVSVQEEEELLAFRKKAVNAQRISAALAGAAGSLGENEYNGISSVVHALNALNPVTELDAEYESLRQRLENCKIELQDIFGSLRAALNNFDFDPGQIDRAEERLEKIKSVKRKYGGDTKKVLEFLTKAKEDYDYLLNADEAVARLKTKKSKALVEAYALCRELTAFRKNAAVRLENEIMRELSELGMESAAFKVHFGDIPEMERAEEAMGAGGWDKAEFLFSANKGEPVKPLAKIASGGEMSRFMLAVKNITARIEKIPTMIFDEIDSGISGNIASVVAQKLAKISRGYQTVAVTHLPQIACMADANYLVSKHERDGKTRTAVSRLDDAAKIAEVQRLVGGADAGAHGGLHAKDMIAWADNYKLKISNHNN